MHKKIKNYFSFIIIISALIPIATYSQENPFDLIEKNFPFLTSITNNNIEVRYSDPNIKGFPFPNKPKIINTTLNTVVQLEEGKSANLKFQGDIVTKVEENRSSSTYNGTWTLSLPTIEELELFEKSQSILTGSILITSTDQVTWNVSGGDNLIKIQTDGRVIEGKLPHFTFSSHFPIEEDQLERISLKNDGAITDSISLESRVKKIRNWMELTKFALDNDTMNQKFHIDATVESGHISTFFLPLEVLKIEIPKLQESNQHSQYDLSSVINLDLSQPVNTLNVKFSIEGGVENQAYKAITNNLTYFIEHSKLSSLPEHQSKKATEVFSKLLERPDLIKQIASLVFPNELYQSVFDINGKWNLDVSYIYFTIEKLLLKNDQFQMLITGNFIQKNAIEPPMGQIKLQLDNYQYIFNALRELSNLGLELYKFYDVDAFLPIMTITKEQVDAVEQVFKDFSDKSLSNDKNMTLIFKISDAGVTIGDRNFEEFLFTLSMNFFGGMTIE